MKARYTMPVIQTPLSTDKYWLKSPFEIEPKYITVHNTANSASAKNEISYMNNNSYSTSFHFAVDDVDVIQALPLNRVGFHAGTENGNNNSIGIEICLSTHEDETKFAEAEKLASKLIACLLWSNGWSSQRVKPHQFWSGKNCPHKTLEWGWDRFMSMIDEELANLVREIAKEEVQKLFDPENTEVPTWANESWANCIEKGITTGERPNAVITRAEAVTLIDRAIK